MLAKFFGSVNLIQWFVFATFFASVFFYRRKSLTSNLVLLILLVNLIAEATSMVLQSYHRPIAQLFTVSTFIHNSLWLLLLFRSVRRRAFYKVIFIALGFFALLDFLYIEGPMVFNCNTFIAASFIYLVIFIYESFLQLRRENFEFFLSNHYLLLFAPVLFFFGLSFVFGFKSSKLASTVLFGNIDLYRFIAYFVNIIYYSLIIIYFYREKNSIHAQ